MCILVCVYAGFVSRPVGGFALPPSTGAAASTLFFLSFVVAFALCEALRMDGWMDACSELACFSFERSLGVGGAGTALSW